MMLRKDIWGVVAFLVCSCLVSSVRTEDECPASAAYTLRLPRSVQGTDKIQMVNESRGVTIVVNPNNLPTICGNTLGDAEKWLDPPDAVQEMISMTIGIDIGVGRLDQEHLVPSCGPLNAVVGGSTSDFVFVAINANAVNFTKQLLTGPDADRKKQHRASKGGNKKKSLGSRFRSSALHTIEAIAPSLPICMAVRPCASDFSITGEDIGKEITFGFFSGGGIILVPAPPTGVGGLELTFHGLAFSSAGDLIWGGFNPPLWGDKSVTGMHLWLDGALGFPIKRRNKNGVLEAVGGVTIRTQIGAYAEINGSPRIGEFLNSLMGCDGADVNALQSQFELESVLVQLYANAVISVVLDLEKLLNLEPGTELAIDANTAFFFEFYKGVGANAHVDLRVSVFLTTSDLLPVLETKLGKFGAFLGDILESVQIDLLAKLLLRFALPGPVVDVGFALDVGLGLSIPEPVCSVMQGIIDTIVGVVEFVFGLFDKLKGFVEDLEDLIAFIENPDNDDGRDPSALYTAVSAMSDAMDGLPTEQWLEDAKTGALAQVQRLLNTICDGVDLGVGMSFAFIDGEVDPANTWIAASFEGEEARLSLDMLPKCGNGEGALAVGSKCLANEDCASGNCNLLDFSFDVPGDALCFGTCNEKLGEWGICTASSQCAEGLNCCGGLCVREQEEGAFCLLDCACKAPAEGGLPACTRGTCGTLGLGQPCLAGHDHHCTGDLYCSGCFVLNPVTACRECCSDQECPAGNGGPGICNLAGKCVECGENSDCTDPDKPVCIFQKCEPKQPDGYGVCNPLEDECINHCCATSLTCRECCSNADCDSDQYCEWNQCKDKKGNGETCAFPDQCLSDRCNVAGKCVECGENSDCPSDKPVCLDQECVTKRSDGYSVCNVFEDECINHCCSSVLFGGVGGYCRECCSDSHCSSGCCAGNECKECCSNAQCGSGQYCSGHQCVNKKGGGEECGGGDECASGTCDVWRCTPKSNGQACGFNVDAVCASGNCCGATGIGAGECGECDADNDCGSGEYCDGCDCKAKLSNGEWCGLDNSICASGNCCGQPFGHCRECCATGDCSGSKKCCSSTCQSTRSLGQSCSCSAQCTGSDQTCSGGKCCKGNTKSCTSDSQCCGSLTCKNKIFGGKHCAWI